MTNQINYFNYFIEFSMVSNKDIQQALSSIRKAASEIADKNKPTEADVDVLKSLYSNLSQLQTKIKDEQNKLLLEVSAADKTNQMAKRTAEQDTVVQNLMKIQNNLETQARRAAQEAQAVGDSIRKSQSVLNQNNLEFSLYADDIKNKMALLATRDRMLQLSQERNVYKKKIIYVLFAIIIALLVIILAAYTMLKKSKS
jgi:hypothetical protein